jgi:hypothetical protein
MNPIHGEKHLHCLDKNGWRLQTAKKALSECGPYLSMDLPAKFRALLFGAKHDTRSRLRSSDLTDVAAASLKGNDMWNPSRDVIKQLCLCRSDSPWYPKG